MLIVKESHPLPRGGTDFIATPRTLNQRASFTTPNNQVRIYHQGRYSLLERQTKVYRTLGSRVPVFRFDVGSSDPHQGQKLITE